MVVRILGNKDSLAYITARRCALRCGVQLCEDDSAEYDLAIAPLLTEKISNYELAKPKTGTLIFHPSPLPYGRGASAIKWAYRRREPITAATWFWADSGLDTGDICEQEILKIDYNLRPRDFYVIHVIPALERTLERCLKGLIRGVQRRVPQVEEYSSFDFLEKK